MREGGSDTRGRSWTGEGHGAPIAKRSLVAIAASGLRRHVRPRGRRRSLRAAATAHDPIGVIVTGDLVQAPAGMATYSGDAYWLTMVELDALRGVARRARSPRESLDDGLVLLVPRPRGAPVRVGPCGRHRAQGVAVRRRSERRADRFTRGRDHHGVRRPRFVRVCGRPDPAAPPLRGGGRAERRPRGSDARALHGRRARLRGPARGGHHARRQRLHDVRVRATRLGGSNHSGFVQGASLVTLSGGSAAFVIDAPDSVHRGRASEDRVLARRARHRG